MPHKPMELARNLSFRESRKKLLMKRCLSGDTPLQNHPRGAPGVGGVAPSAASVQGALQDQQTKPLPPLSPVWHTLPTKLNKGTVIKGLSCVFTEQAESMNWDLITSLRREWFTAHSWGVLA